MEIKLDAEAVASIASAAIFDSLSQDVRESVIKQAIEFLLTPEPHRGFGDKTTPLQVAFNQAIHNVAAKVVQEHIRDNPEINAAILELIGPLLNAALNKEAEGYTNPLAEKLGEALGTWLSDQARK